MGKKLILSAFVGMVIVMGITLLITSCQSKSEYRVEGKDLKTFIQETPYNDEYDFYTYEITEINENEVHGKSTLDNTGVYLLKEGLNFEVKKKDKILVVFERGVDDNILDVMKLEEVK